MAKRIPGTSIVPVERVERSILLLRGYKVVLDSALAELYGVSTKALVQAVNRNVDRFPSDFMFRLSKDEFAVLRSQSVTSSSWGGRRYPPYAFTEHGVAMLSGVLKSKRAVLVNIEIMRAFARLRQVLSSHESLGRRLNEIERKYDEQFKVVFDVLRELMNPKAPPKRRIGFQTLYESP